MTTRFRLRLLANLTLSGAPRLRALQLVGRLGVGAAAESQLFEIQDVEHGLSAFYGYGGLGAGAGFTAAWLSGTDSGPWNYFTTSARMNVGDFDGTMRFTTAGGGNYTANLIHILGTPDGVDSVYMRINTGTTYGIGISTTAGELQLVAGPMRAGSR